MKKNDKKEERRQYDMQEQMAIEQRPAHKEKNQSNVKIDN